MDSRRTGDAVAEVEIDLGDDSESEGFDNGEEPQTLWRAQPSVDDDDYIHTSALVEISDTKPLITSRDPRGINDCLKVLYLRSALANSRLSFTQTPLSL